MSMQLVLSGVRYAYPAAREAVLNNVTITHAGQDRLRPH